MDKVVDNFWKGKQVFVTGHTGFKGAWLTKMLKERGANITGYSLAPSTIPSLYEIDDTNKGMNSIIADIRDFDMLKKAFDECRPEIIFHLAAQPIVRESYKLPRLTYETNVMGTVNLFECIRESDFVKSVVNVTTDKVYENKEWEWGYRENEPLNGYDPYSNSKSCSELVTQSYNKSFFRGRGIAVSTCRAGNVIGGGDFASDRIIPDCVRAVINNKPLIIRNPSSTRPYQHVYEPLNAYMLIAEKQYIDYSLAGNYNIGPNEDNCISTLDLVKLFEKAWGTGFSYKIEENVNAPHEAYFLKLDCSKIKNTFGWVPQIDIETAVKMTVDWTKEWIRR